MGEFFIHTCVGIFYSYMEKEYVIMADNLLFISSIEICIPPFNQ